MGDPSIFEKIRWWIGGIGYKLFLWSINSTVDEYCKDVYLQEKALREND